MRRSGRTMDAVAGPQSANLRAAHVARARPSRARSCHYSVGAANRSLHIENCPDDAAAKTTAKPLCHPLGQAAPHTELYPELLRCTRLIHAQGPVDFEASITRRGQAQGMKISRPRSRHSRHGSSKAPDYAAAAERFLRRSRLSNKKNIGHLVEIRLFA